MLLKIYNKLLKYFGKQHWWPARTRFEVIVGAILTQNTNWKNVEKAIANLRKAGALSPAGLAKLGGKELRRHIRPSGFFNQKAERLRIFLGFLKERGNSLGALFREKTPGLRAELLALKGIGPETADSILLYAGGKLSFVVDAYTKRVFSRFGLVNSDDYEEIHAFFQDNLPKSVSIYKEYHALIVELAKRHCRKKPLCAGCPLSGPCEFNKYSA